MLRRSFYLLSLSLLLSSGVQAMNANQAPKSNGNFARNMAIATTAATVPVAINAVGIPAVTVLGSTVGLPAAIVAGGCCFTPVAPVVLVGLGVAFGIDYLFNNKTKGK